MTGLQVSFVIQPIAPHHDRQGFTCGHAQLDHYLHKQASQDTKRHLNTIFVATKAAADRFVLGYYTLCSLSVETAQFPIALAKKLPQRPVPCTLLGRLAVAQSLQGSGLGRLLLSNAIRRTQVVSQQIGIHALVVDAIDSKAFEFYQKFGFQAMEKGGRLFLPIRHDS